MGSKTQLRMAGTTGSAVCEVCHRPLMDPESIQRGMGPRCAGRLARRAAQAEASERSAEIETKLSQDLRGGIVIRRASSGAVLTNVPHLCVEHSPTGLEFGYGGSGPADLALNVVEAVLRSQGYRGETMALRQGRCFALAWLLHQDFKSEFVATLDAQTGGDIEYQAVVDWIEERRSEFALA